MKKSIIFFVILLSLLSCRKNFSEKLETTDGFSQSLLSETSTSELQEELSSRMSSESYNRLNWDSAYVHEILDDKSYVYQIPFGSAPDFTSFVLARIDEEGKFVKGAILEIKPTTTDDSTFSGTIKFQSLDERDVDTVSYINNDAYTNDQQLRVLPSGSGGLPEVTVTHCQCANSPFTHYLYLDFLMFLYGGEYTGLPLGGMFGSIFGYSSGGGSGPIMGSGSGGASTSGSTSGGSTPIRIVSTMNGNLAYLTRRLSLTIAQVTWLQQHFDFIAPIVNYLGSTTQPGADNIALAHIDKLITDSDYFNFVSNQMATGNPALVWWEDNTYVDPFGGLTFGTWAIDYIGQNLSTTFATFKNQFMGIREGEDGDYDVSYWDDPYLYFPPQTLPSWSAFSTAYPKHHDPSYDTPEEMYTSVGSSVLSLYNSDPAKYQNTCALRISKALNYSGVTIPAGTDRYQGADGKCYFVSCTALLKWMKKTFGTPTGSNHLTGTQGGTNGENFPGLLAGKKGIYIMIPTTRGDVKQTPAFALADMQI